MARALGSFPHPVLGNSDDVNSTFRVSNVVVNTGVEDVEIVFDVVLDDNDLLGLIDDGKAKILAAWSCAGTLSSSSMPLTLVKTAHFTRTFRGYVDQRNIRGKVIVSFKIIASEQLDNYSLSRQHRDYGGASFQVLAGDVLGEAGAITFDPTKKYDPLAPPVGSCFKLGIDEKRAKGFQLNLNNDEYVTIMTSPDLFSAVKLLRGDPNLLISSIILPALMQVVAIIQEVRGGGDRFAGYSDSDWFKTIQRLMDELPKSDSGDLPILVAQKLLEFPADRAAADRIEITDED